MEKYIPQQQNKRQKIENFWYYHKWHLLCGILILCMILVATFSCINREQVDLYVLYIVTGPYTEDGNRALEEKLAKYSDDIDENGKINVQVITISFSEVLARTDQSQEATLSRLVSQVSSGSAILYVFDDENFQELQNAQADVFSQLNVLDVESEYLEEERYDATAVGFFDDLPGFDNDTYYFGLRNYEQINEDDDRYVQIAQAKNTLTNIIKAYN